ncbi:ABC transporter ATP-binding protein [Symbiobacterium thermophilum]|uniref:ABC transporter ATP-binding protein n=2 Tax=Symbiobacterium thermophilum TaxID=2734 RepID=Q67RV0_SYMTH|nr:ABC transporter ATP-binding protein [Symbiobacterium thermophilum]BAD39593.1 ABC transporter ATP-binding protein [Symbiobacterium thermophilum IAM 14863]
MSARPLLEAEGLVKEYPMGVRALDGASLSVGRGEIVGIMGRSGSGKSTLLHILGCLDRPDAGRVWIDGIEVTQLSDAALPKIRLHHLGFVFQAHNLVPTLTALENVALPLRYVRPRPADPYARARELLEAVGLGDRMHHLPGQLSGGQQQRVAIARALVNNPALVLADEPTGSLDSQSARALLRLMRRLCQERGQTFVVVTHDPAVGQVCDRIYHMVDGRVLNAAVG